MSARKAVQQAATNLKLSIRSVLRNFGLKMGRVSKGLFEARVQELAEGNPVLAEQIAEASGSVYEVMAHLSHSAPKTAAIYPKRVHRARLAERAALRVEAAAEARSVPRPENRGTLDDVPFSKVL